MIFITDTAQKYLYKLLINQKFRSKIRIFIINPGTIYAECCVSYCHQYSVKKTDTKIKLYKLEIYVDDISIYYLQDAKIDFIINKLGSQLTLKAPNAKKITKLSSEATLIERVKYMLQLHINPKLANHGGQVTLIKITDDMFAILQFKGGCNGCYMVNYIFLEKIEKKILKIFPELKGVIDSTNHQIGKSSYY